jgi:hypothetical protein
MRGNFVQGPVWSDGKLRKEFPLTPIVTYALSPEDIEKMTAEEINVKVKELLDYNEWKHWRESGFKVTYPNRAVGIEHIFFKCTNCNAEFNITSSGATFECSKCQAKWELTEDGFLKGIGHDSKFDKPDEWIFWQKAEVKKEVESGTYNYEETVRGMSLPNRHKHAEVGTVSVKHDTTGMSIKGHYNGEDFRFHFTSLATHTLQIALKSPDFKGQPSYIGFSVDDDSIFFVPSKIGMAYKLFLAWQDFHKMHKQNLTK